MDRFLSVKSVKLTQGLGDCLIAGGMLTSWHRPWKHKMEFVTSPVLAPILKNNPNLDYRFEGDADIELKWPSQLPNRPYELHTIQRFSTQLDFYADPTDTLDLFNDEGKHILNDSSENIVCINSRSAEHKRRYIPWKYLAFIEELCKENNLTPYYIGDGGNTNIVEMRDLLSVCRMFVGPVSFPFHLAGCLNTKSMLFGSYMPTYKLSHFVDVEHIDPLAQCHHTCEKDHATLALLIGCHTECLNVDYDLNEIKVKFEKLCKKPLS